MGRFRDVLAVREFRSLWFAELLSTGGDQLARVGLSVLVYQRTSSAGLTALTYALTFAPALLGGLLLAGLADRLPRRRVIVATDLVRAALAALIAVPALPLPVTIGLVFLLTFAGAPFKAAQQAILVDVLPRDRYRAGLAVRSMTNQIAQLAGFAGSGAILVFLTPTAALAANALSFALSAVIVVAGVRPRPAPVHDPAAHTPDDERRSGLRPAVRAIWRDPELRHPLAVAWIIALYVVPEGLAAPYAASIGASAVAVSLLLAADPAGSVLGGWLAGRLTGARHRLWSAPLAVAAGLPLVATVFRPGEVLTVLLWGASGAASMAALVLAQAAFMLRVPSHLRGTAAGVAGTGLTTVQGVALLGAGLIADATSPAATIAGTGVVGAVLAIGVGLGWRRRGPADDATTDDPTPDGLTSPCSPSSAPPHAGGAAERGTGADRVIIAPSTAREQAPPQARSGRLPWRWQLWRIPPRAIGYIVAVEVGAVALGVALSVGRPVSTGDLGVCAIIVAFGVAVAEMTRHVERVRRRFNDTPHVNLTSVWMIPAALLLPAPLVVATVLTLYLHLYWRSWYRVRGIHAYRLTFSAASVTVAALVTMTVAGGLLSDPAPDWDRPQEMLSVALSVLAYSVVNSGLVGVAIALFDGRLDVRRSWGTARENVLEYGTLGLGAINGVLIALHPLWSVLMIPALMVLHKSVLLRQLEESASRDPKTGLLNATSWTNHANAELDRVRRDSGTFGVLVVDLDHFKAVNDQYGHLSGDRVIQVVADAITAQCRRYDAVGRWGGDEFVVLCPDVTGEELRTVGERVCATIRELVVTPARSGEPEIDSLTVSIGAASFPGSGPDLSAVLQAADDALFVAKGQGRNRVAELAR